MYASIDPTEMVRNPPDGVSGNLVLAIGLPSESDDHPLGFAIVRDPEMEATLFREHLAPKVATVRQNRATLLEGDRKIRADTQAAREQFYAFALEDLAGGYEPWQIRSRALEVLRPAFEGLDVAGTADEFLADLRLEAVEDAINGVPLREPVDSPYPPAMASFLAEVASRTAALLGERGPESWSIVAG